MKYINEFRNSELADHLSKVITLNTRSTYYYHFMEFCGGHTHTISRYGIADLLPSNIEMIHGPGCPICVLPIGRIDLAIELALEKAVILCVYADAMRVPGSKGQSLFRAKAQGADIRMVYSVDDSLKIAHCHPDRMVVFFAIGFETTTPPTAVAIKRAAQEQLKNFSVLCCHVLTPPAITAILNDTSQNDRIPITGFIGPGHVSSVIGYGAYELFAAQYHKPVVIAGFEPLDVMRAILMLIQQVNAQRAVVENEYLRAVTRDGNRKAQFIMDEVFELRDSFEWRGLGTIPASALKIRERFADFDSEQRFNLNYHAVPDNKGCECAAILRGLKKPAACKLFGRVCVPENPVGSCMVSSEGACAAYYLYGRATRLDKSY